MTHESEKYMGTETILVVDDEEPLRNMLSSVLKNFGYEVIDAVDGVDAVEKYSQYRDRIDFVLTDIMMPRKDGISTYIDIKSINPDARIMFMSGFVPSDMNVEKNIPIITKPFKPLDIALKIRSILDSEKSI